VVHIFNQQGDQLGFRFASDERKTSKEEGATDIFLKAPMPGTVTKIYKKPGDTLHKGDSILAMEAMKM
jgi:biotin carboxyl carrier protein